MNEMIPHVGKNEWDEAIERRELIAENLRSGVSCFLDAGVWLAKAFERRDWETLGLENFALYCAQFHISKSVGYDLLRLAGLRAKFPQFQERMIDAGISNLRLLLPRLETTKDEDEFDTLIDDANTLSWTDLRAKHYPENVDDPRAGEDEIQYVCPNCGARMNSRKVDTAKLFALLTECRRVIFTYAFDENLLARIDDALAME